MNTLILKHRQVGRCPSPPIWACYDLDDSSDCSSDDDDERQNECSEDDEDYSNEQQNPPEPAAAENPEADVQQVQPMVVDEDLARAANIPLPPSPAPVLIEVAPSPLDEAPQVEPLSTPIPDSMDVDAPEQPPAPPQTNDSNPPHEATAPHASSATPAPPRSPPANKVDVDEDGCFDITPEEKRQRALDKGKGRVQAEPIMSPTEETTETPVTPVEPAPAPAPEEKIEEEEDRSPTPTPPAPTRRKYRPILTIRSSHGWLWNQELFVPQYMKDRCTALIPELPSLMFTLNDAIGSNNREFEVDTVGITLNPEDLDRVLPAKRTAV